MSATLPIQRLAWDSEFFGFAVARVPATRPDAAELQAAVAACQAQGVRCAYLLLDAGEDRAIEAAQAHGFVLRDVRVELNRRIRAIDAGADSPRVAAGAIAEATPAQHEGLLDLARSRFTSSRFFADPGFPRERCRELYAAFLQRGLGGDASRFTLATADVNGFVVCHVDAESGSGAIELIAVADSAAGRGVGVALVEEASRRFARAGLRSATVVTQGHNVAAQRIYQRGGYRTSHTGLWLHRWFD